EVAAILDELHPRIVAMHAQIPPTLRDRAVIVVADTQHSIGAAITRAVMGRAPHGKSLLPQVGTDVAWFAQPRETVDVLFAALGIPIPAHWSEPLAADDIRVVFLVEDGLVYA